MTTWRTISGCMAPRSPAPHGGVVATVGGELHQQGVHEELGRPVRIAPEQIPAPERMRALDGAPDVRIRARAVVDRLQEARGPARPVREARIAGDARETEPLRRGLGV